MSTPSSAQKKPWSDIKVKPEVPANKVTFEDIKRMIEERRKAPRAAGTCAVFYGERGTGKTGAALDCRTPKEIKDGKKVFIIDVDGNAKWTADEYWGEDENVILIDPIRAEEDGSLKDQETYDYIRATVAYSKSIQNELKCIIFDGLDRFLKICEDLMKEKYLHIPIGERVSAFDWGIRNTLNNNPLYLMNTMRCMRIYITHMKVPMQLVQGRLVELEPRPDFQRLFPNSVIQEVFFTKEENDGRTILKAKVKKSNTRLSLEGAEFIVGTNSKAEGAKWYGLKEMYTALGDFE
ncbi:MAG: hypothetical protein N2V78_09320 [Methanophagales archaeon]|nr:hypothetical protein [Methanophagales archaeon]